MAAAGLRPRHCKLRDYVAKNPGLRGVVLAMHGVISWASSSQECYENTLELIATAATYLNRRLEEGA